jgi:hypothetical protein
VLAELDRGVLEFAAAHQRVQFGQVSALAGLGDEEADQRLRGLTRSGLLVHERLWLGDRGSFRVTSAGLAEVADRCSAPGFEDRYRHALGVVWVWLAARAGTFGPLKQVLSERQMRAEDLEGTPEAPFGVELGSADPSGGVEYPDLLLVLEAGRVPVVLLLGPPSRSRLPGVLRAYAMDARVAAVLFLVSDPRLGEVVHSVAAELELSRLVQVHPAKPT